MSVVYIICSVVAMLLCVAIVAMILLQKKRAPGISGAVMGMGASQKTYYDKNKGRTLEGALERYTKICGAVFMVLSLVLNVLR